MVTHIFDSFVVNTNYSRERHDDIARSLGLVAERIHAVPQTTSCTTNLTYTT